MISFAKFVYEHSPVWLQNVVCSAAGLRMYRERYNKVFRNALAFLRNSEWWTFEKQKAHQDHQLRELIQHAYSDVPYYRRIFESRDLRPSDIQSSADLWKLPILDKHMVRENFLELQASSWPQSRKVLVSTGGTTGTALKVVKDIDTIPWQWAVWWRHRKRFGLNLNDPFIVFAGRYVVPLSRMDPPIWRRNFPLHQTYVSVHHMTKNNMPALVNYLNKRRVNYYSGYPSALYLLASYLIDERIELRHPPRLTVTGAETLLDHQRHLIQNAFDTEVTDQYGASEGCCNISECEHHAYHIDMEFGIIEFLPMPGMPENVRRVVCTGLRNPAMPLIRYDIGDVATLSEKTCPCGRKSPMVEKIDGRIESYIITPDGRQLGRLDFLFKESCHVEEAQLIQNDLDNLVVKVVKNRHYGAQQELKLLSDLRSYLGPQIKIEIHYVDRIPREPNGKFRQIVSSVFCDRHTSN